MYLQLGSGPVADEVLSLRGAVDEAAAHPGAILTVGIDNLRSLDAPVLNSLIAGLRRLRNRGGGIRLLVTRRDLLASLDVTGLNRVFEVVDHRDGEPAVAAPRAPKDAGRKSRLADGLAGLAVVLCVLAGASLAAFAQESAAGEAPLSARQVVAKVVERDPNLGSFQAHVDVRMHTGIPFLNPTLEGTTYFKRPGNYEVVFTRVPAFARGVEKLYSDVGDVSSWDRRFAMSIVGEQAYNGHRDLVIRLVQRVRGMIDHEDVLIDPKTWTIEKMAYYYYNGGTIALEQAYRNEGGFNVLSDQHATIALPHIPRAIGTAHYSDYRLNVAIDDSVFTMKETKEMGTR